MRLARVAPGTRKTSTIHNAVVYTSMPLRGAPAPRGRDTLALEGTMGRTSLWIAFAIISFAIVLQAASAHAQATRTWVSGVGDDANPCTRTAPCKTFAGAISKTAPNGEIN